MVSNHRYSSDELFDIMIFVQQTITTAAKVLIRQRCNTYMRYVSSNACTNVDVCVFVFALLLNSLTAEFVLFFMFMLTLTT